MNTQTVSKPTALEQLALAEYGAWLEYLGATRDQPAPRYREVEPWAWAKLQAQLRAINARRDKVTR